MPPRLRSAPALVLGLVGRDLLVALRCLAASGLPICLLGLLSMCLPPGMQDLHRRRTNRALSAPVTVLLALAMVLVLVLGGACRGSPET